jgi:hypothetical protein
LEASGLGSNPRGGAGSDWEAECDN